MTNNFGKKMSESEKRARIRKLKADLRAYLRSPKAKELEDWMDCQWKVYRKMGMTDDEIVEEIMI